MIPKLSPQSQWLLLYMLDIHPKGQASTNSVPCFNVKHQPRMAQVRGLQRRGWLHEPAPGIFYITEDGMVMAKLILSGLSKGSGFPGAE